MVLYKAMEGVIYWYINTPFPLSEALAKGVIMIVDYNQWVCQFSRVFEIWKHLPFPSEHLSVIMNIESLDKKAISVRWTLARLFLQARPNSEPRMHNALYVFEHIAHWTLDIAQCTMFPLSNKSSFKSNNLRPILKCKFCHAISKNICLNVLGSKQSREILVFVNLKL